jgi:hypothetical protein
MKAHYSATLGTDIEIAVNSINAARNCYVHRRGLVTQGVDATDEKPLRLCWIGVVVETYGVDGELKSVNEPADLGPGGLYMFGSRARVYAKVMVEGVYQYAEEIGLHFGEELERIWKQPSEIYLYLNTGPNERSHHQAIPVDWRDGRLRFASSINFGGETA